MRSFIAVVFSLSALAFIAYPAITQTSHTPNPVFPPVVPKKEAVIMFAGDMMFDRAVRVAIDKEGGDFIFSCIADTLRGADVVVANLEGPVTANPSRSVDSTVGEPENTTFTFPPDIPSLLYRHNIRIVNLGNNHILNFGYEGVAETKQFLDAAGVGYFGDPTAPDEAGRVAHITKEGILFSFVNWSDWTGGTADAVAAQIAAEKQAGRIVVVYTHWGNEYVPPIPRVRNLAHRFVDAGAALVIGSHPHVVQESEMYREVPIYYSLGNLIFDQYWDASVRNGLLVRATFDAGGLAGLEEIPTELMRDGRVCERS